MNTEVEVKLKRCSSCRLFIPRKEFGKSGNRRDGLQCQCKVCKKRSSDLYLQTHSTEVNARARTRAMAIRLEAIAAYGGKCECCEEARQEFLAFDHVYGGGNRHKKADGIGNMSMWLKRHGYPKDKFRLLCHNCNMSLGLYGYCPHGTLAHHTDSPEEESPPWLDEIDLPPPQEQSPSLTTC